MDLNSAFKAMYCMPTEAIVPKDHVGFFFPLITTDRRVHRRWKRHGISHTFKRWTTLNSETIAELKKPLIFILSHEN